MLAWEQRLGPAGNEALASRYVTHNFLLSHNSRQHKSTMSQASNECLQSKSRTDSIVCDQVNGNKNNFSLSITDQTLRPAIKDQSNQVHGNSSFQVPNNCKAKVDSRATKAPPLVGNSKACSVPSSGPIAERSRLPSSAWRIAEPPIAQQRQQREQDQYLLSQHKFDPFCRADSRLDKKMALEARAYYHQEVLLGKPTYHS